MKIENKEELAKVLAISTENYKLDSENDCCFSSLLVL